MGRLTNEGFEVYCTQNALILSGVIVLKASPNDVQCKGFFNNICLNIKKKFQHSGSPVAAYS